MNHQEVYERVAKHLIAQGERAMTIGICSYRDKNNKRCAIGYLIPDEKYTESIEGVGVTAISNMSLAKADKLKSILLELGLDDFPFLSDLQLIHDGYKPVEWPRELTRFALKYKLKVPSEVFVLFPVEYIGDKV